MEAREPVDLAERLNNAIKAVESRLGKKIALPGIAGEACFSPYHFHRVFTAVVGETPGSYIRRRRLTCAALELLAGNRRIIDLAFDWQFKTQESFARAFYRQFGLTPSAYRRAGLNMHALFRLPLAAADIRHLIRGDVSMIPRIVDRPAIKLAGITLEHTLANPRFVRLWGDFMRRLPEIGNAAGRDLYDVFCHEPSSPVLEFDDHTPYRAMAAVEVLNFAGLPAGIETRTIPARKYALFTHKGPVGTIKETYNYIYRTSLPTSAYDFDSGDEFSVYGSGFKFPDSLDNKVDVYVPVRTDTVSK